MSSTDFNMSRYGIAPAKLVLPNSAPALGKPYPVPLDGSAMTVSTTMNGGSGAKGSNK